jgi:hypothetical protein
MFTPKTLMASRTQVPLCQPIAFSRDMICEILNDALRAATTTDARDNQD